MFLAKLLVAWAVAYAVGDNLGGAVGVFVGSILALGWTIALGIHEQADANERWAARKKA